MGFCRAASGVRSSTSERVIAAEVLCLTRADECGTYGDEMRVRLPPIAGGISGSELRLGASASPRVRSYKRRRRGRRTGRFAPGRRRTLKAPQPFIAPRTGAVEKRGTTSGGYELPEAVPLQERLVLRGARSRRGATASSCVARASGRSAPARSADLRPSFVQLDRPRCRPGTWDPEPNAEWVDRARLSIPTIARPNLRALELKFSSARHSPPSGRSSVGYRNRARSWTHTAPHGIPSSPTHPKAFTSLTSLGAKGSESLNVSNSVCQ